MLSLNFIRKESCDSIQKKNNLPNYPTLINHQLCGLILSVNGEKSTNLLCFNLVMLWTLFLFNMVQKNIWVMATSGYIFLLIWLESWRVVNAGYLCIRMIKNVFSLTVVSVEKKFSLSIFFYFRRVKIE